MSQAPAHTHIMLPEQAAASMVRKVVLFLPLPLAGVSVGVFLMGDTVKALIFLALIPVILLLLVLLNRDLPRLAVFLLTLIVLITVTWSCTTGNGIHDIGIMAFPLSILFASLLLRPGEVWAITGVAACCLAFLVFGEKWGWFQPYGVYEGRLLDIVVIGFVLVGGLVTIRKVSDSLKDAIVRAKEETAEQQRLGKEINENIERKYEVFKEVHHRVKNHLALVNSLIDLEAMRNPTDQERLRELKNRVIAVVRVHDQLYHSDDYATVETKAYLESIISQSMMTWHSSEVRSAFRIDNFRLPVRQVIYLGIAVHEAIGAVAIEPDQLKKMEFVLTEESGQFVLAVLADFHQDTPAIPQSRQDMLSYLAASLHGKFDLLTGDRRILFEVVF
jgi:hypothetical protein